MSLFRRGSAHQTTTAKSVSSIVVGGEDAIPLLTLYVEDGVVKADYQPENLDEAAQRLMQSVAWAARS